MKIRHNWGVQWKVRKECWDRQIYQRTPQYCNITWWWRYSHAPRWPLEWCPVQGQRSPTGRCGASAAQWFCPPGRRCSGRAAGPPWRPPGAGTAGETGCAAPEAHLSEESNTAQSGEGEADETITNHSGLLLLLSHHTTSAKYFRWSHYDPAFLGILDADSPKS